MTREASSAETVECFPSTEYVKCYSMKHRNTNIATTMDNDMRVGCDRPRGFYLRILDSALAVVAVRR